MQYFIIRKWRIRHLMNSFVVFVFQGFTVALVNILCLLIKWLILVPEMIYRYIYIDIETPILKPVL